MLSLLLTLNTPSPFPHLFCHKQREKEMVCIHPRDLCNNTSCLSCLACFLSIASPRQCAISHSQLAFTTAMRGKLYALFYKLLFINTHPVTTLFLSFRADSLRSSIPPWPPTSLASRERIASQKACLMRLDKAGTR
jgi:hypothetical protein